MIALLKRTLLVLGISRLIINLEFYMRPIIALIFLCLLSPLYSASEIISIPSNYGDTQTAYWPSSNSKAVLLLIPGGEGNFDIARKNPPKPNWVLSILYNKSQKHLGVDLVFFDSPYSLGWIGGNIAPRYTKDHLGRLLSVINFFKAKTSKPIYLIGHSNGTISVSEFLNQSSENQALLAGAILSASRNETKLNPPLNVPILFLHHEDDANGRWTSYGTAQKLYDKALISNSSSTQFLTVHGGDSGGNPSISGHHMYEGSLEEAAGYLWEFILKEKMP